MVGVWWVFICGWVWVVVWWVGGGVGGGWIRVKFVVRF
jgi:hypothetical protein